MKGHSLWTMAAALVGAALVGLLLTVVFNLMVFGRPDRALLQVLSDLSGYAINCDNPAGSRLFQANQDSKLEKLDLNWLLFDQQGQLLADRWVDDKQPEVQPTQVQIEKKNFNRTWQPVFFNSDMWVKQADVCQQGWNLYLNDHGNKIFLSLMLKRQSSLFFLTSSSLIFAVLSFWWYLHRKGQEATRVLRQFASGNRQARIPLRPWENSFELIHEFNRMADRVAHLVDQIQSLEDHRSRTLAELAHDIRTPVASMLSGIETLNEFQHEMSAEQHKRLLYNLSEDAAYFRRLIDDLFLFASIDSYTQQQEFQDLDLPLLTQQCWNSVWSHDKRDLQHSLQLDLAQQGYPPFKGDSDLMRRMLLNLIENARRYALTRVSARLSYHAEYWQIVISNDSKPLSSQEIENWGRKRQQRIIRDAPGDPHTSLGLGSSIACQIAQVHGGEASLIQDGIAGEVSVKLVLPRDHSNFQGFYQP